MLTLTLGELLVNQDLTIDGDKDNNGIAVSIDGNHNSRILRITGGGTDVAVTDLTLTNARSAENESGGAVFLGSGSLALNAASISNSSTGIAYGYANASGGGIFAGSGSLLSISKSTITEISAADGGGIAAESASLIIRGSLISGNSAFGSGGGYEGRDHNFKQQFSSRGQRYFKQCERRILDTMAVVVEDC